MAPTMQEKQHVGREVALRYLRAWKKEKGVMLQEFCTTTGYSPPYTAYLCKAGDPGESDSSPYETLCLLQNTGGMSPAVSSRFTEVIQHHRLL